MTVDATCLAWYTVIRQHKQTGSQETKNDTSICRLLKNRRVCGRDLQQKWQTEILLQSLTELVRLGRDVDKEE
jgi:hypothetical protein